MVNVRAAIVAYDPGPALVTLVAELVTSCEVHVVDNASAYGVEHLEAAAKLGATVTRLPANTGVAGALQTALEAVTDDDAWLLTLDQDSRLLSDTVAQLRACTATLDPRVAVVAPVVRDQASGALLQGDPDAESWYLVPRALTSGALCRVAALRDVGGFRRELFIDLVDWDLCARLQASGWTVAIEPGATLLHSIGTWQTHRVPGLGQVVATHHSADRQYYKVRNYLLLAREGTLGGDPAWAARYGLGLGLGAVKVLLFEPDKRRKLAAMAKGVGDGLAGRGGPRPGRGWRPQQRDDGARPPVSVCMATYNGSAYLRPQIDSILAQLQPYDELLVQDDGSTDDTLAILDSYGDARIQVERNVTNAGVVATFERVLARAQHSIVFLSDQDDEWLPGKVDAVTARFADRRVMGVVTEATIVDEAGLLPDASYFAHRDSGPGVLRNFVKNSYLGCCLTIRREVLDIALPIPRSARLHDGWLGICADLMGRVVFDPTPYVRYRRHAGNASQMVRYGLADVALRRLALAANLVRVAPAVLARR